MHLQAFNIGNRAVDRPVEDDESEAAIRAQRAAAVAVDASQIIAEARVPGYVSQATVNASPCPIYSSV